MSAWRTARAWAAVHATRPALTVMVTVALASLIFGRSVVENLGFIRLLAPVSVLLLLPAVAGVGAAIACDNTARLPLPDPVRARVCRAAWVLGWTLLAVLVVNIGGFDAEVASIAASSRNVLLYTGIGLFVVWLGYPGIAWLPPLGYTIACMLFGSSLRKIDYYWWAAVLKEQVTIAQAVTVGVIYAAAVLAFVLVPRKR